MTIKFVKASILCFALSFANAHLFAKEVRELGVNEVVRLFSTTENNDSKDKDRDCTDGGCAKLVLAKLCANKIKSACIDSTQINTDGLCSSAINTESLCANTACIESLNVNNICIANPIVTGHIEQCGLWRATVVYSAPTTYTLGAPLNFNAILDDPNSNISTTFPVTTYMAPRTGYYIITLSIDDSALTTTSGSPILGAPIANPQILVNGTVFREAYLPFLTFHNQQKSLVTCLVSLNVGDLVSGVFNVFTVSDAGFIPVVGTVMITGDGTEGSESLFKIHYLSSSCTPGTTGPCAPCGPCATPCTPCASPCM